MESRGAQRSASVTLTRVGKNVTMPAMIVTAPRSCPKMTTISGVMATRGTERNTMAMGISVRSTGRKRLKAMAQAMAATVPATSPKPASRSVVSDSWSTAVRLADALAVTNR